MVGRRHKKVYTGNKSSRRYNGHGAPRRRGADVPGKGDQSKSRPSITRAFVISELSSGVLYRVSSLPEYFSRTGIATEDVPIFTFLPYFPRTDGCVTFVIPTLRGTTTVVIIVAISYSRRVVYSRALNRIARKAFSNFFLIFTNRPARVITLVKIRNCNSYTITFFCNYFSYYTFHLT